VEKAWAVVTRGWIIVDKVLLDYSKKVCYYLFYLSGE